MQLSLYDDCQVSVQWLTVGGWSLLLSPEDEAAPTVDRPLNGQLPGSFVEVIERHVNLNGSWAVTPAARELEEARLTQPGGVMQRDVLWFSKGCQATRTAVLELREPRYV